MTPNSEPVGWQTAATALAVAAIPLLRAFNVSISEDQSNAILGFLAAAIVFLGLFVRSKVTTVTKAESAIGTALNTAPLPSGTEQQSKAILAETKV